MSSSQTSKTEIPDATPEEKALMEMMTGALMPQAMQEAGYDVKQTTQTYDQTNEYKNFQEQRSRIDKERAGYEKQLTELDKSSGGTIPKNNKRAEIMKNISNLNAKMDAVEKEESTFISTYQPKTTYDVRKMLSPELEAERRKLVQQYGDLTDEQLMRKSREYRQLYEASEQQAIDQDKAQTKLAQTYMEKTQKFLDGDFAITDAQKQMISENMAPIKASVDKMFADAKTASEKTASDARGEVAKTTGNLLQSVKTTFDSFNERVKETGMNMIKGLETTGAQIRQTGSDMETALKNTIGVHKELMKIGIEDYTGEVTKAIATNAAMIGRSPDDPEYASEMQQLVAKKVQEGSLNLASMEAQGMIAIKERTGAGLEDVTRGMTAVAERTGSQLEGSDLQRGQSNTAIMEREGQAREGITNQLNMTNEEMIRAKGAADIGLEETAANLRWQVGAGMAPQQVGMAQGVLQYNEALAQQRIQNASNAMYAPMPYVGYMQQERMAEPTTTTRTSTGIGGIFSGILGAASAGASIASGVGTAKAMGGMVNQYANNPWAMG